MTEISGQFQSNFKTISGQLCNYRNFRTAGTPVIKTKVKLSPNSHGGKCRSPVPAERARLLADEIEKALSILLWRWTGWWHVILVQLSLAFCIGDGRLEIHVQRVVSSLQTRQHRY